MSDIKNSPDFVALFTRVPLRVNPSPSPVCPVVCMPRCESAPKCRFAVLSPVSPVLFHFNAGSGNLQNSPTGSAGPAAIERPQGITVTPSVPPDSSVDTAGETLSKCRAIFGFYCFCFHCFCLLVCFLQMFCLVLLTRCPLRALIKPVYEESLRVLW